MRDANFNYDEPFKIPQVCVCVDVSFEIVCTKCLFILIVQTAVNVTGGDEQQIMSKRKSIQRRLEHEITN